MDYSLLLLNTHKSNSNILPTVPTRAQVCGYKGHFQGIVYHTQEFGDFPGFMLEMLQEQDLYTALAQHKALGDTHVTVSLTGAYRENSPMYPPRLREGHDHTHKLAEFKATLRKMICAGLFIDLSLGGDGRSKPKNSDGTYPYNDPVGDTYGFEWLMDNIERILKAFRGDIDSDAPDGEDLTKYILFRPGYDGVFYGWGEDHDGVDRQPQRVIDFGAKFRSVLPNGYLAIEHTPGNLPVGEGTYDWAPENYDPNRGHEPYGMRHFDTIMAEFDNWPQVSDAEWQIAGRTLGPAYHRPSDQPSGDDPNPPFYLAAGTPRGPWFPVAFEFAKYVESHGSGMTPEEVERGRQYYKALGYTFTGQIDNPSQSLYSEMH